MSTLSRLPDTAHPIRLLVVDDSVVVRRVITRAFERSDGFEVIGSAANGRLALEKIEYGRPDVIVLDLDMPEMDGFEVLAELRRRRYEIPVVVFSSLETSGSAVHEALTLGAADIVVKPSGTSGTGFGEEYVRIRLVPSVRQAVQTHRSEPVGPVRDPLVDAHGERVRAHQPSAVSVVVIAVSTGGPDALATVITGLPRVLRVPVLVVQHMPPVFTRTLAERLDRMALLDVFEARHGQKVTPGQVYVAPGGRHMEVVRTGAGVALALTDGPKENSCRPSADVLFRSAAEVYGDGVLAVVLTGMGHDGLRGSESVLEAGGRVLAQSAGSSVIATMPAAVAGLADVVASLDDIAAEITSLVARTS